MNLPKLSVIVPCYNHEKYVVKCLESIPTAYAGELEVIVCDDKSKDNSVVMIERFIAAATDTRITYKFIKHAANMGVCRTLNECVQHATADYIYLIASDDYLVCDGLTNAITVLLENNSDAVISDCIVVDDDGKQICASAFFEYRHASHQRLQKDIAKELVFNWIVPGPALLQKKKAYMDMGGYNEELMAEDRDYYLRLLSQKKVVFSNKIIAGYRVHLNNLSRSDTYKSKATAEFNKVNYAASGLYTGLTGIYLKSYWYDIKGMPSFLTSKIRKVVKALYILRG